MPARLAVQFLPTALVRRVLRALPPPLLRALDAWSRRQAQLRAERRREAARASRR